MTLDNPLQGTSTRRLRDGTVCRNNGISNINASANAHVSSNAYARAADNAQRRRESKLTR